MLDRGNGFFKTEVYEDSQAYYLEGKYLNYQKQGMWKATTENGRTLYEEEYNDGELIRGMSFDQYGNSYHYLVERVTPQPEKGMQHFITHLHENTSFPDQIDTSFEGKVELKMTFDSYGKLQEVRALSASDPRLGKSVETLARSYGEWQSGTLRGQRKKMTIILPVNFSIVQF